MLKAFRLAPTALVFSVFSLVFMPGPPLLGQEPDFPEEPFRPPIAGGWEPAQSLGQPRRWRPFLSLGYGVDNAEESTRSGATYSLGVYRDLASPVYGTLGISGEVYGGQRGEDADGGLRLNLESPAFFVYTGLDWNQPSGRADWAVGLSFPPHRGGLFMRGGEVRVAYMPRRGHSFHVAATLPIRQPLAGRTRPRHVDVEMPPPPRGAERRRAPVSPRAAHATEEMVHAMGWLTSMANFFWFVEQERLGYEASVREWREVLTEFGAELDALADGADETSLHEAMVRRYHASLDRAFGLALGAAERDAERVGRPLGDRARRKVLEEVVFPYNRTIGQYKKPDRLDGLIARARARWSAWIELDPPPGFDPTTTAEVLAVLDAWLFELEELRARIAGLTRDSRMHWLPMALVLRPEEHRTQRQIDELVARALGRGFESGNAVLSINALQFQQELERSLHDTRTYHVLWIHDYRGRDAFGRPDRTAFRITTEGYLRALLNAVRAYDETGRLPVFNILLDQHYYELNDGRRWMTLLENPLTHRVRLPSEYVSMSKTIEILQDSLRAAVSDSRRLQAEARAFGSGWVEDVVKVHVNITNPSDLSFRSRRILLPPLGADNLLRDHRKVVIRDVFEDDPSSGEVMLSGVGIGDHYATATWEDRALIIQGPSAAEAVVAVRQTLARHRLSGSQLPAPLRPRARATNHAQRVRDLETTGATARFLQVHNRTGWGVKDATFVQMLLYDLAPSGTLLYAPDSLWSSYQWVAQLVSAALRGCHVYIVGPALANAPSDGFPVMSLMQELFTRLVVVEEVFGERIRAGGGDLRIGLFTREVPLDDLPGIVAELTRTFEENAFLRETFPFPDDVWRVYHDIAESNGNGAANAGTANHGSSLNATGTHPIGDREERVPQLHRKTQWIVNRELVQRLAADPNMPSVAAGALAGLRDGIVHPTESGPLTGQVRLDPTRELIELYRTVAPAASAAPLYYASGTINKNLRSMALDGEALGVVAGSWAIQPFLDFVMLAGGVTWIRDLDDVERLLPPYSTLQRRIGRLLRRVL